MRCTARRSGLRCCLREHDIGRHVALDNDGTPVWWSRFAHDLGGRI